MTSLESLAITAVVSLLLSAALCAAIYRPLQALLAKICPDSEAIHFWARFTLIMLVLSPLFVAVAFGLPPAEMTQKMDAGVLLQRIIAAALIGAFLAMLGMGLWVSALIRRAPASRATIPQRDPDHWGERRDK
jgi:drug/metabolite transporter (DMT)-like permease